MRESTTCSGCHQRVDCCSCHCLDAEKGDLDGQGRGGDGGETDGAAATLALDEAECVDERVALRQLQEKEEGAVLKELARSRSRGGGGGAAEEDGAGDALVDVVEGLSRGKALVASALAHDTVTPTAAATVPARAAHAKVKVE